MDTGKREGIVFHVSKLGDDTDGLSWNTAFRTVQKALDAVPDDRGGHTIVIRPDTYVEANLFPAYPGAAGSYNRLIGDWDGRLGSGTSGHVVIDSGDPALGFKSYDWWGALRANQQGWSDEHTEPSFSAIGWDRWFLRHLYVTGGDGGLMWDGVDRVEPFTVVIEDCVSIGRAFGGGVESSDPTYPAFTTKFARSDDLRHWRKIPEAIFGTNRYTACPCIRHVGEHYYMLYLENRSPGHYFETYVTRSRDLLRWETSAANPVLCAEELDEGINASDPEIIEIDGRTWIYFAVGDQLTWMNIKRAVYPGSLRAFFESWYARPGVPDPGCGGSL